jgi:hypothetical protein
MFKLVITMKKNPDLSYAEFKAYYNKRHLPFMGRLIPLAGGGMKVHRRNFVVNEDPFEAVVTDDRMAVGKRDFDVMTEVVFEKREDALELFGAYFQSEILRQVQEDEGKFVQLDSVRFYVVDVTEIVRD